MQQQAEGSVVCAKHEGEGAYIVNGTLWKVGARYELIRVIGQGSFSVVCLARDTKTDELVAVKKIRDVFVHKTNAKNVIREVYIQRRLRHPNVVELKDLFLMPSPTGKWKLIGGKLVTDSVDLYLVLEYTDGGDLFHMSEQLTKQEVRQIMVQLLHATQFLHSCGVIHRDIKSANILIKTNAKTGRKTVKLGDFGCARSEGANMRRAKSYETLDEAEGEFSRERTSSDEDMVGSAAGGTSERQGTPSPPGTTRWEEGAGGGHEMHVDGEGEGGGGRGSDGEGQVKKFKHADGESNGQNGNFLHNNNSSSTNGAQPQRQPPSPTQAHAFVSPRSRSIMTTAVATPCYRAPEVVMSLDSYTSSVDIWSLGCIFAELLARWHSHSKGYCRTVRVEPLFNLTEQPRVMSGQHWDDGEGASMAHRELRTVFEVIGTPAWALVDQITDLRWRKFLHCLPCHAATLMRRFPGIGEKCLDLLRRMLEFDPNTRCSATEALTHEYFAKREEDSLEGSVSAGNIGEMSHPKGAEATKVNPGALGRTGSGVYSRDEASPRGEVSALLTNDKETFNRFELELECLLLGSDAQEAGGLADDKLKQVLEKEIEEHKRLMVEEEGLVWRPVEITTPQKKLLRHRFFKSDVAPVNSGHFAEEYHMLETRSARAKASSFIEAGRHHDWTTNSSCSVEPHWRERATPAEPVWGVSTMIPGMGNKDSVSIVSNQQGR